MKSLVILLITTFTQFALATSGQKCPLETAGQTQAASENTVSYDFEAGDVVVDSVMGFVRIDEIADDYMVIRRLDIHASPIKRLHFMGSPTKIYTNLATKYVMAKTGTPKAGQIIRQRIENNYGIEAIQRYFTLYRIMDLVATPKSNLDPSLAQAIQSAILVFSKRPTENYKMILADWTFTVFQREIPEGFEAVVGFMEDLLGESLVRSGILKTLELRPTWKNDRWPWPPLKGAGRTSGGMKNKRDKAKEGSNITVQMDIDHYARSLIWGQSFEASPDLIEEDAVSLKELRDQMNISNWEKLNPSNVDYFKKEWTEKNHLIVIGNPSIDVKPLETALGLQTELISPEAESANSNPNLFATSWLRLYNMAVQEMNFSNTVGKTLQVIIPATTPEIPILVSDIKRRALFAGALRVNIVILDELPTP